MMENDSKDQSTSSQDGLLLTTNEEHEQKYSDENLLIVWLIGSDRNKINDFTETYNDLISITKNLELFNDVDQCIDYITAIDSNINVFLILSSHQFTSPLIYLIPQITLIYIYNTDQTNNNKITYTVYVRPENIFNYAKLLMDKIRDDIRRFLNQQSAPVLFFNDIDDNIKQKSTKDLSKESKYFMYMHLFSDILLRYSETDKAKDDFLNECRQSYYYNKSQLERIDEFENDCGANEAIRWYTSDSFLYRLLNEALRCQDFVTIYKFRYIIKRLYDQLKHLYVEQVLDLKETKTVYRGQLIHKNELKNLEQNQGGLLSMNSFLSTTRNKETASVFIVGANEKDEIVPVLFEININNTNCVSTPYADVQIYSSSGDEQEILFSIDCVFQINSIKKKDDENSGICLVKLTLINQYEEDILKHLTDYIRKEISNNVNQLSALAYIMFITGHFHNAKYFHELLERNIPPNHPNISTFYRNKGAILARQGNYPDALKYFMRALSIESETLPENHLERANTYKHIAAVYIEQGIFIEASKYLEKALEIQSQCLPKNHPDIARTYNNIALVHYIQENYVSALEYWEEALKIQSKCLPKNHPDIAGTYSNIGLIYGTQDNYAKAIEYFDKALQIESATLHKNHPDNAVTYNCIGYCHAKLRDYTKAMNYFEKALDIQLNCFSDKHPDIAVTYNHIGCNYFNLGDYPKALEYQQKALKIQLNSLSKNHRMNAVAYENIGIFHCMQENYDEALKCYAEVLNIKLESLPENHHSFASTFYLIRSAHEKKGNLDEALKYHEKELNIELNCLLDKIPDIRTTDSSTEEVHRSSDIYAEALSYCYKILEIQSKFLPLNDPDIAKTYNKMGFIYKRQGNYVKAIHCYGNALDIQLPRVSENNSDIVKTYWNIGNVYSCCNNPKESREAWQKALTIASESSPLNHSMIARLQQKLISIQTNQSAILSTQLSLKNNR